MKSKKFKWLLLSILVFVFALVGCSSNDTGGDSEEPADNGGESASESSEGDVVLRVAWWGGQERHDMTLEAIELFEAEYPHITVEPEFTGWDGYWEKLNTQAAASNLPDVINMDNSKMNEYNSRDLLTDLTPYIEDGTINLDNVDDVYQEINHIDGEVLAVSLGANALAAIVNETLLEEHGVTLEPGYTYDDVKEAMLKIGESASGEFFGYDLANAELELFTLFARQSGESLYNADGTGFGYEDETLVKFLTIVQDWVTSGAAPSHDITMEYVEGGQSMVGEGSAAIQTAASNQIIGASQQTEDTLGLTLLPALEGGQHGNWIRPSMSFAISSHSKQQEAAAQFIDFFTNSLEANEILRADRGVPISSEVREHLSGMVEGPVKATFDYLELVADYTSPADPLPPAGESEVRGAFQRMIELIKYDRMTPEDGAQQFRNEAEAVLK
ncbi:ABC transporter substrate-binding protein [Halalkalibacter urbisdiaboli]|uniref:ABC transporter substrate-binding protein n=1 Tax=Halalkalibacter urbisdiaboli TaxID=1960589 RepID=UPI000B441F6F|nr:extracellular solute-binding protein [Halalkalibacter urbisdiaboli]